MTNDREPSMSINVLTGVADKITESIGIRGRFEKREIASNGPAGKEFGIPCFKRDRRMNNN
jgi:hypothetical protein